MSARNSKRGVVKFDQDKGRLRIALPMGLVKSLKEQGYEAKRYNYTGLEATQKNELKVAQVVEKMNQDLSNPYMAFDPTLEKYLDLLKPRVSSNGKTLILNKTFKSIRIDSSISMVTKQRKGTKNNKVIPNSCIGSYILIGDLFLQ